MKGFGGCWFSGKRVTGHRFIQGRESAALALAHGGSFWLPQSPLTPAAREDDLRAPNVARCCAQALADRGYEGAFSASPNLSDDAVRERRGGGGGATAAAPDAVAASPPPAVQWGPMVPELNKTVDTSGDTWRPGDRRALGGFDARFHSAAPCASFPVHLLPF